MKKSPWDTTEDGNLWTHASQLLWPSTHRHRSDTCGSDTQLFDTDHILNSERGKLGACRPADQIAGAVQAVGTVDSDQLVCIRRETDHDAAVISRACVDPPQQLYRTLIHNRPLSLLSRRNLCTARLKLRMVLSLGTSWPAVNIFTNISESGKS